MELKSVNKIVRRVVSAMLLAGFGAASLQTPASAAPPDEIFVNGAVYTEDTTRPWAEAIAVGAGKYLAVGTDVEIRALADAGTRITDLHGRMMMPGLIDDHVHAVDGAMGELYDCLFDAASTPAQVHAALARCVAKTAAGAWISGGYWATDFFKNSHIASPRRWLDEVSGDRPVLLRDDTGHNAWVNSAALKAAGIDAHTKDPTGGHFEREADGMPDGVAFEAAAEAVQAAIKERSAEEHQRAVLEAQSIAHRLGIIGIKEADASEPAIAAYQAVDHRGGLTLYVATCISTLAGQDRPDKPLDFAAIDRIHSRYASSLVDTAFVKIYLDGVPTPARTAAMLEPYLPDAQGKVTSGELHLNPDVLAADLVELDRRGYTVKMHAAGDRAIRTGLDAIAAARRANPAGGLRHELAHAEFISPQDLGRFHTLNAVAEFSPVIWYPSPIIATVAEALGARSQHMFPIRALLESGAPLAAGSDWPSVVPSMDPWAGIETMVTRRAPKSRSGDALWPEQAITLAQALGIYTQSGAAALRRGADTGSIVAGKYADFIVLDRNLFKVAPTMISGTKVLLTVFHGRVVYGNPH
jgi:predicted amidohydrolase YtcJ